MLVKAYAKVNLGLAVVGKRSDGYHDIDTLFARLELHDIVRLEPREEGIVLETEGADLPSDASNLAYRAAQRYFAAAGLSGGVAMFLQKHIPIAAGLGGWFVGRGGGVAGARWALSPRAVTSLHWRKLSVRMSPFFYRTFPQRTGRGGANGSRP